MIGKLGFRVFQKLFGDESLSDELGLRRRFVRDYPLHNLIVTVGVFSDEGCVIVSTRLCGNAQRPR